MRTKLKKLNIQGHTWLFSWHKFTSCSVGSDLIVRPDLDSVALYSHTPHPPTHKHYCAMYQPYKGNMYYKLDQSKKVRFSLFINTHWQMVLTIMENINFHHHYYCKLTAERTYWYHWHIIIVKDYLSKLNGYSVNITVCKHRFYVTSFMWIWHNVIIHGIICRSCRSQWNSDPVKPQAMIT